MTDDDSKSLPEPKHQDRGWSEDPILHWMKENRLALTREAYLNLAYMGDPPSELEPEQEAELPKKFQR